MTTKPQSHKPVPEPDELTQPFWDAANRRKLVIQRCQACKRYHHPPAGICIDCLSTNLVFEPVSGRGRIYTYTITHDARQPAFEAIIPYTVAVVELDEQPGLFMLSQVPGTPPAEIKHGLRVAVDFEEVTPGRCIPQFRVVR